jgi:hypothetical protein
VLLRKRIGAPVGESVALANRKFPTLCPRAVEEFYREIVAALTDVAAPSASQLEDKLIRRLKLPAGFEEGWAQPFVLDQELRTPLALAVVSELARTLLLGLIFEGVFLDAVNPSPGIFCTSPVQTFLDLSASGERGNEAAQHLRSKLLRWSK